MSKTTKFTATPYGNKRNESVGISATPIAVMTTTDVVIGVNLQINKSVAKRLFFLFEEQTERLLGEVHLIKSTYTEDNNLHSDGNLEHEHTISEACDKIHEQIAMYNELRNQVLTALIGERE